MTSKASIRPYLNQAYLLGLLMVAVGLTLSPFLMGMSQFWLVIVWFVDALTSSTTKLPSSWLLSTSCMLLVCSGLPISSMP